MKKRILLVAMPNSLHTCRWIDQIKGMGWDVHLFPSIQGPLLHPGISGVRFHHWLYRYRNGKNIPWGRQQQRLLQYVDRAWNRLAELVRGKKRPDQPTRHAVRLARLIKRLKPDLVHSMEIQAAGYLTLEAKQLLPDAFPPWLATNWGSDLYLFGRLEAHKAKIRAVLASCQYYSCECQRDVELARQFGFAGRTMEVFPNTGGFDLDALEAVRNAVAPSARRVIMLKGYQGWAGRALFGLQALEQCVDALQGYEVALYSADDSVVIAAELFAQKTGIPVRLIPIHTDHQEMLAWHGKARISIGLSISDGISTSLLEAMVMGSFPIQSCTACTNEWLTAGVSGAVVPPGGIDRIAQAIRMALSDDALVDRAAAINWAVARERLDHALCRTKTIAMYQELLGEKPEAASEK